MMKKVLAALLSVVMLLSCSVMCIGAAEVGVTGSAFKATLEQVDDFMASKTPEQRRTIYDFLKVYLSTDAGVDTLIGLVDNQSEVSQLVKDYILSYGVSDNDRATLKMYLTLIKCVPVDIRRTAVENWHARLGFDGYDATASYAAGVASIRGYLFGGSQHEADGATDAVFYQMLYNLRDLIVFTASSSDPNFEYEFRSFTNADFKSNIETYLIEPGLEINGTAVASAGQLMNLVADIINDDANITVQMKKDFAETLVTTNTFVYKTPGTIIVPSGPSGSGTGSSGSGSGTGAGVGTGAGTGTGEGTIPTPKPNMLPGIPEPSKVGFVTANGTTTPISGQKVTFQDVENHWAKDYVDVLATAGFLRGHSETNYEPELGVTREEMAVILARVLGVEGQKASSINEFNDHDSIQDYAKDAVYKMVELGIYKGYGEGHFAPQQILTREEISALFSRVLGTSAVESEKVFDDHGEIKSWFTADVENLVNYGVISGYPDETFRPDNDVTRAEASVMLYNTLYRLGIIK